MKKCFCCQKKSIRKKTAKSCFLENNKNFTIILGILCPSRHNIAKKVINKHIDKIGNIFLKVCAHLFGPIWGLSRFAERPVVNVVFSSSLGFRELSTRSKTFFTTCIFGGVFLGFPLFCSFFGLGFGRFGLLPLLLSLSSLVSFSISFFIRFLLSCSLVFKTSFQIPSSNILFLKLMLLSILGCVVALSLSLLVFFCF